MTTVRRPMRVRLFNVKYSPNLGDGLLSESLENALKENGCDPAETYSIDLAARTEYGPGSASRAKVLKVLSALPGPMRRTALQPALSIASRRVWEPHYKSHLAGADAVVIGGGNLFSDIDLNFPTKLAIALSLSAERALPIAIHGVGVASGWSQPGLSIVRKALRRARLCHLTVRDEPSRERFETLFSEAAGRSATIARDPGLLVSRYVPQREKRAGKTIGLSITSAIAIRYHSSLSVSDGDLAEWYVELAAMFARRDHRVVVFTNGSPEDETFLDGMEERLHGVLAERFERRRAATPTALAQLISGMEGIVAHRMHALIAAYSYGVPIFALKWDSKVDAFMRAVGLPGQIVEAKPGAQGRILAFFEDAEVRSQMPGSHAESSTLGEAFEQVKDLVSALSDRP